MDIKNKITRSSLEPMNHVSWERKLARFLANLLTKKSQASKKTFERKYEFLPKELKEDISSTMYSGNYTCVCGTASFAKVDYNGGDI